MHLIIFVSLFVLSSVFPAHAQTQCSYTFVDVEGDSGPYTGQCQNGEAHGVGTVVYDNGDRYEGEFQHGLNHGQGTFVVADGGRYEGAWQHGKPTNGTLYFSGGTCEFRNGQKVC